jgi:hypothetical protein
VTTVFTIAGTNFLGTGTQVLVTGSLTGSLAATSTTTTAVKFSYQPTTTGTYTLGIQLKFADGTVSNVLPWTLVVR